MPIENIKKSLREALTTAGVEDPDVSSNFSQEEVWNMLDPTLLEEAKKDIAAFGQEFDDRYHLYNQGYRNTHVSFRMWREEKQAARR